MNIFVLDTDPKIAAQYHCDKHCNTMLKESCQMLSTSIKCKTPFVDDRIYKMTHVNHPATIWARTSKQNFIWLTQLADELLNQFKLRYKNDHHKCSEILDNCKKYDYLFDDIGLTPFAQCMPEQFMSDDAVYSYRLFVTAAKSRFFKFDKLNNEPEWYQPMLNYVTINNLFVENLKNDGVIV